MINKNIILTIFSIVIFYCMQIAVLSGDDIDVKALVSNWVISGNESILAKNDVYFGTSEKYLENKVKLSEEKSKYRNELELLLLLSVNKCSDIKCSNKKKNYMKYLNVSIGKEKLLNELMKYYEDSEENGRRADKRIIKFINNEYENNKLDKKYVQLLNSAKLLLLIKEDKEYIKKVKLFKKHFSEIDKYELLLNNNYMFEVLLFRNEDNKPVNIEMLLDCLNIYVLLDEGEFALHQLKKSMDLLERRTNIENVGLYAEMLFFHSVNYLFIMEDIQNLKKYLHSVDNEGLKKKSNIYWFFISVLEDDPEGVVKYYDLAVNPPEKKYELNLKTKKYLKKYYSIYNHYRENDYNIMKKEFKKMSEHKKIDRYGVFYSINTMMKNKYIIQKQIN